jgi:hypothetical protein
MRAVIRHLPPDTPAEDNSSRLEDKRNSPNYILEWLCSVFGLLFRFNEHLQNINGNNYVSLIELWTPTITVTTAHIKSSQFAMSSKDVACNGFQQCPLFPCSRFYLLATV